MKINICSKDICYTCKYGKKTFCDAGYDDIFLDDTGIICDCRKYEKAQVKASKHAYGELNNVMLTDDELQKLKEKFPDYRKRIDALSFWIGSKGAKYKSHYRTILMWDNRDKQRQTEVKRKDHIKSDPTYNLADYRKYAINNTEI